MADDGVMGGDLNPDAQNEEAVLRMVLNPDTYKGLSGEEAQRLIDEAKAGLSPESRRIVDKVERRGRRG